MVREVTVEVTLPPTIEESHKLIEKLAAKCAEQQVKLAEQEARIHQLLHDLHGPSADRRAGADGAAPDSPPEQPSAQLDMFRPAEGEVSSDAEAEREEDESAAAGENASNGAGAENGAAASPQKKKRAPAKRRPIPANVERVVLRREPEQKTCTCCGQALVVIGEDRTELYDAVPMRLRILVDERPRYACNKCKEGKVVQAPALDRPIERAMATAGLIALIATFKWAYHLPLARLEKKFADHGLEIALPTMCSWVNDTADIVEPLVNHIRKTLCESPYIHADETTIQVLDHAATKEANKKPPQKGRKKRGKPSRPTS
ncbi:MAG TPA: transposase, partial [Candidatus Binatia bacterium]|nr:transposase [Candidatus Binatia bacterium]